MFHSDAIFCVFSSSTKFCDSQNLTLNPVVETQYFASFPVVWMSKKRGHWAKSTGHWAKSKWQFTWSSMSFRLRSTTRFGFLDTQPLRNHQLKHRTPVTWHLKVFINRFFNRRLRINDFCGFVRNDLEQVNKLISKIIIPSAQTNKW